MIVRAPHLQDDILYDCYYAERRGESIDPPAAEHLVDCEACTRRYSAIESFLTTLTEDADAEISALFPQERLRQQQLAIAKQLEFVGRPARVITFPGRRQMPAAVAPRPSLATLATTTRTFTRWIAAAAAAGLFVGVAAGTAFNFVPGFNFATTARRGIGVAATRQVSTSSRPSPHLSAPVTTAEDFDAQDVVDRDDRFMSDLESALDRPHTSELVAFDALTPHVREIRDFAR